MSRAIAAIYQLEQTAQALFVATNELHEAVRRAETVDEAMALHQLVMVFWKRLDAITIAALQRADALCGKGASDESK